MGSKNPLCLYCNSREANSFRGLCRYCYDNSGIRKLFPPMIGKRDTGRRLVVRMCVNCKIKRVYEGNHTCRKWKLCTVCFRVKDIRKRIRDRGTIEEELVSSNVTGNEKDTNAVGIITDNGGMTDRGDRDRDRGIEDNSIDDDIDMIVENGIESVEPTLALPGSKEKVEVLEERFSRRVELFHPNDARLNGEKG